MRALVRQFAVFIKERLNRIINLTGIQSIPTLYCALACDLTNLFLDYVKNGMTITIKEDGVVEVDDAPIAVEG